RAARSAPRLDRARALALRGRERARLHAGPPRRPARARPEAAPLRPRGAGPEAHLHAPDRRRDGAPRRGRGPAPRAARREGAARARQAPARHPQGPRPGERLSAPVILASTSPRRAALLAEAGIAFEPLDPGLKDEDEEALAARWRARGLAP